MTAGDGELRRLLPPTRKRPGILAVLVRWRGELLLAGLLAGLWSLVGGQAVGWIAGVTLVLAVLVRPFGRVLLGVLQALVTAHRVRSGLVQAGVAGRNGRPPWIVTFSCRNDVVYLNLWFTSGTAPDDVRAAAPVIAAATGANEVALLQRSLRQDRAVLAVVRPRWGWPTR